jgi:limonene-1,2-epoxide hydrolase
VTAADTVRALWAALDCRDWAAIADLVAEDCIYYDVPLGPAMSARGGADIVKRLKLGLEPLADYSNHEGVMVSAGEDVLYEHSETWTFDSGEIAVLPFVSVHKVRHAKIAMWKDYWDLTTLQSQAPSDWMDRMAGAEVSWVFDATNLV